MKRKTRRAGNASASPAPWNVLVYLAADNSLVDESVFILTEILKAQRNNLSVTAQFEGAPHANRYKFEVSHARSGALENTALQNIGASIDRENRTRHFAPAEKRLGDFLIDGLMKKTEAACNLVVLSGHGDGAVGSFLSPADSPVSLTIRGLRKVLEHSLERKKTASGKIDILGLDSCLMSTAEVGYEVREHADFLIGSEGFGLNLGWPYREVLAHLDAHPTTSPQTLAGDIAQLYVDYYSVYTLAGTSVDQAACDLRQMGALAKAVRELARLLCKKLKSHVEAGALADALVLAHWRAQSYNFELYVDLWDFCGELRKTSRDPEVQAACRAVQDAVAKKVVIRSCFSGAAFQHSHGVSIYFPWTVEDLARDRPAYQHLQFDQDTKWSEFLALYVQQTRRPHRVVKRSPTSEKPPVIESMPIDFDLSLASLMRIRDNKLEGTRDNKLEGTRNSQFLLPKVKNAPTRYPKFRDGGCCPDPADECEDA